MTEKKTKKNIWKLNLPVVNQWWLHKDMTAGQWTHGRTNKEGQEGGTDGSSAGLMWRVD